MTVQSWVVPFIFLALMLGVYLLAPQEQAPALRAKIQRDMNLLLICELGLIVPSIAATLVLGHAWIDWLAWLALAGVSLVVLRRLWAEVSGRGPDAL